LNDRFQVLEGTVRHAGDAVRVSAELIDTSDDSTKWSERYRAAQRPALRDLSRKSKGVFGSLR